MTLLRSAIARSLLALAALAVLAVLLTGCGGADDGPVSAGSLDDVPTLASAPVPDGGPAMSDLAELIVPAGRADRLVIDTPPVPVGLSFEAIGVELAGVIPVGVEPNGDMEIPGAAEVGWYRYGPSPGEEGSAVLAAHVAYDGRDGVFRRLPRVQPGDRFAVFYADGAITEFEVVALTQYAKDELPLEAIFAPSGDPTVTLITCGGRFNRALRSYEDNIVAYAVPVSDA